MSVTGKATGEDMPYPFYDSLFYFFIYAFLGWITEVIYAAFQKGKFINRGFLLGPVCPIYGFGVVLVLSMLEPLRLYPGSVFVLAVLITSALELFVGLVSEKVFHERLWDYSNRFLNIGGYVCLRFSLIWGVACMGIFYFAQPLIGKIVSLLPRFLGVILLIFFSLLILLDAAVTLSQSLRLEKRMRAFDEVSRALEGMSDRIGKNISDRALRIREKISAAEKNRPDAEAVRQKYKALVEKKNVVHEHLFHSFDRLKSGRYGDSYRRLSEARKKSKEEKKESENKK